MYLFLYIDICMCIDLCAVSILIETMTYSISVGYMAKCRL
jgi:hypothetical protein